MRARALKEESQGGGAPGAAARHCQSLACGLFAQGHLYLHSLVVPRDREGDLVTRFVVREDSPEGRLVGDGLALDLLDDVQPLQSGLVGGRSGNYPTDNHSRSVLDAQLGCDGWGERSISDAQVWMHHLSR